MKKSDREIVFNKYGGKCAYCGRELQKGWHVDHAEPILRKTKFILGNYYHIETGEAATEDNFKTMEDARKFKYVERKEVPNGCHRPEHDSFDNLMPSCPPCNIHKGSASVEVYRGSIERGIKSLNKKNPQYRTAKRYGLIQETGIEVKFYFETI